MPGIESLISLGDLTKPATTLIEKISDAVGGIFRPYQTRRMAEADADAAITRAQAEMQITDLQRRAMHRFVIEEGQKQENIENVTRKALKDLASDAKPENIENDWIANFFDKSRLVSDQDMQELWARVLAGEANNPGFCSKRTVSLLSSMDKTEAQLFQKLCSYVWEIGRPTPIVFDSQDSIYNSFGINLETLQHLELIGLIKFETLSGFRRMFGPSIVPSQGVQVRELRYFDELYYVELPESEISFPIGNVVFTVPGAQLAFIVGAEKNQAFSAYALNSDKWRTFQITRVR